MKNDFRDSIKGNISTLGDTNIDVNKPEDAENTSSTFVINKKVEDKRNKKAFNIYMNPALVKELDRISKQTGWSRNEVINKMCNYCVINVKIE